MSIIFMITNDYVFSIYTPLVCIFSLIWSKRNGQQRNIVSASLPVDRVSKIYNCDPIQ